MRWRKGCFPRKCSPWPTKSESSRVRCLRLSARRALVKTYLAEQAADTLKLPFKRFDMSSYADHQAHISLIGFAPSYKDAKPGMLTEFVKKHPHSILLLDEIEKAHLNTIQLFLQILDAGRLHDDFLDEGRLVQGHVDHLYHQRRKLAV